MGLNEFYQDWEKDLKVWRMRLRHLRWLSDYRVDIINSYSLLKDKNVLDMGSGPQFTADLLKQEGAAVTTLDKYAPCDIPFDINQDYSALFEKKFDAVLLGAVIRYVKDKKLFWDRMEAILNEGAFIFLDEYIHNPINNSFLGALNFLGAMEELPWDDFCSLDDLKQSLCFSDKLRIDQVYSCWPTYFLMGEYPFALWYSVIIKKTLTNADHK